LEINNTWKILRYMILSFHRLLIRFSFQYKNKRSVNSIM
jgi:hypothetical protein